jgi:hypothetical protein
MVTARQVSHDARHTFIVIDLGDSSSTPELTS